MGAGSLQRRAVRRGAKALQDGELDGKRIGCWCKPTDCHGDVLVKIRHEQIAAAYESTLEIGSQAFYDYYQDKGQ